MTTIIADETAPDSDNLISIGRIVRARGLKGQLKVQPFTDFLKQFSGKDYFFLYKFGECRKVEVENVQFIKGVPYILFKGVDSPEKAQESIGWEILIEASQRTRLPKDTYYFEEIEGFQVESETGEPVGILKDILKLPAADTFVVNCKGKEALIPFVGELVLKVDKRKKVIIVKDMPSLWEGGEEV